MSTGPGHLVNTLISMKVPTFVSHTQSKVRWSHIKTSPTTRISNFCYACTCLISLGSGVSIAQCLAGYCFFPCCHTYTTHHFAGRTTSTNQKFQQKNYAFSKCPDIVCESVLHVCVSVCLCMRWLLTFVRAQIAPYTTCLVNGVFWAPGTPRLLTLEQCKQLLPKDFDACQLRYEGVPKLPQRLLAIADISCDLHVCLKEL